MSVKFLRYIALPRIRALTRQAQPCNHEGGETPDRKNRPDKGRHREHPVVRWLNQEHREIPDGSRQQVARDLQIAGTRNVGVCVVIGVNAG